MYLCFDDFTIQAWRACLRRFAREQRHGIWHIWLGDPSYTALVRASLSTITTHVELHAGTSDTTTVEFLPCLSSQAS